MRCVQGKVKLGKVSRLVRTRNRPNGDVYVAYRSAQASHLGNITYVRKRWLEFEPDREEILPQ